MLQGKKNHVDRNSSYSPYFLNMQKIFCFEWDGHAWHWDVVFMGCTIADICPDCKCNGLCLKWEKEGRKKLKKKEKTAFPLFPPQSTNIHWITVVTVVAFPNFGSLSQNSLLVFTNLRALSYTTHFQTRKRPLCSLKALQVMKVKMNY